MLRRKTRAVYISCACAVQSASFCVSWPFSRSRIEKRNDHFLVLFLSDFLKGYSLYIYSSLFFKILKMRRVKMWVTRHARNEYDPGAGK